jgi:hypothetical protein
MNMSPLAAGTYSGFTTDAYGRLIGYDASGDTAVVQTLISGAGTTASVAGGVGRVDVTDTGVASGTYAFGGFSATVNSRGQLINVVRDITLTPTAYRLGAYDVTVTDSGSISAIVAVPVDTTAVPTTFVAQFQGDINDPAPEREVQFTSPVDGYVHIHYEGYMGVYTGVNVYPGLRLNPAGFGVTLDGAPLARVLATVVSGTGTSNVLGCVGIRATTAVPISAGTHIVTVYGDGVTNTADGFIKIDIVGLGA